MLICCSWDDWVPHDRLRKFTEENKELAQDLKRELDDSRARAAPKSASTKKKTAGSDFSSARGSEERHSSLPVTGRGSKRGRDTEIEKVGGFYICYPSSPCPDLESDTSESGWSGAFDHAITPEVEPDPVFACYDGTGDPPARRSERKPKPRAVFEQDPVPAPQPKRRKNTTTTTTPAVQETTVEDPAVTTKTVPNANKLSPPTSTVEATRQTALSTSDNQDEIAAATAPALINKENGSTVNDTTVVEGKAASPMTASSQNLDEPSETALVTGEALAVLEGHPSVEVDVISEVKASTTRAAASPGTRASQDRKSSSSLTPPPSTDEAKTPTPKPTAKPVGRKPAAKSNAKGKEKTAPPKSSTRSAASSKEKPSLEILNNASTSDPPKSAAKGKGKALPVESSDASPDLFEQQKSLEITENGLSAHTSKPAPKGKVKAAKGKGKALPVDSINASLDPVEPQQSPEVTENGLSAKTSKPTAKGTVKGKGKSSLPTATSNVLDNDSPPAPTKPEITSKAKGAKGKNNTSLPGASETLASLEPSDTSEGFQDDAPPDPPKPESQEKGNQAEETPSPPESTSSFRPRTTLEVLQNNPPKSSRSSMKPPKPRFEKALSKANHLAERAASLGGPQRIPDTYLPESNRYRHHEDKHYFYAGIPADMNRKPRKFMGPAKVSKQRAEWMRFRKMQRRAGLSRSEINRKWDCILAEAEKSRLHSGATNSNGNDKDSSTSQGTQTVSISTADQGSSSSSSSRSAVSAGDDSRDPGTGDKLSNSSGEDAGVAPTKTNSDVQESSTAQNSQGSNSSNNTSKKRKSVTFASDVPDPDQDSLPKARHRVESPPKRTRTRKNSEVNIRSYESLQEESFLSRAAVRIPVSDHLKALLVDDWEAVTKNLSLVPLPSEHPVTEILADYLEEEKAKRRVGSAEYDLLEEVVAGVKEYFNRCLGRILLYRFEREQFFEISKLWDEGREGWEGKGASDVYGAEHLTRLFGMFESIYLVSLHRKDKTRQQKKREEAQAR